ncbi:acyltransferase family protein [Paeniglutamicibacter sp. NPDC012692]|uniref:acyltransferase family protein n=1 Tax=Paeniglutamicibacter sp. NPDC012692 TaxID=3364388 RepID=UPI00369530B0
MPLVFARPTKARTMAPAPAGRERFKLLDGLRFFAAFAVLAYHYIGYSHVRWGEPPSELFPVLSPIAAYGALGVDLFFIISGFVILMSAQNRSVGAFAASRISRLFPAYWFAVLSTVFLYLVIAPGKFPTISGGQVLANLTMVQQGLGVKHIDGVYWTLWVELLFYILVCGLICIKPTERKIMGFAILWPIVAMISQQADSGFLKMFLSPQNAPLFAGGMGLYLIHKYGHNLARWLVVIFNALIAAQQATAYVSGPIARVTKQELSQTVAIVIVLGFFVLVALATVTPLKSIGPSWLTYAGALTYPLYLVHEAWGWWLIQWVNPIAGQWSALLLAVAFSLALAVVIERFVERPLHPILNRTLKKNLTDQPKEVGLAA